MGDPVMVCDGCGTKELQRLAFTAGWPPPSFRLALIESEARLREATWFTGKLRRRRVYCARCQVNKTAQIAEEMRDEALDREPTAVEVRHWSEHEEGGG